MPRVLVVDEIPQVVRMLELELRSQGFEVLGAQIDEDVVGEVGRQRPDVVLLELVLPAVSGFDLLTQLHGLYPEIPVFILTSQNTDEDRADALEAGAVDFMTKPFSPVELAIR